MKSNNWSRVFSASSVGPLRQWAGAVARWNVKESFEVQSDHLYGRISFAPVRFMASHSVRPLIDGEEILSRVWKAINRARDSVWISAWQLIPEIFLCRSSPVSLGHRFDRLLFTKAREGIRIFILLSKEASKYLFIHSFFSHFSSMAKKKLESIHPNVFVIRHPPLEPRNWMHHQKFIVVDNVIAFVGGVDISYGSWDSPAHLCIDANHLKAKWPGKDYCNPHEKTIDRPELPFRESLDRNVYPRMPNHCVAIELRGGSVWDVGYNFIQRWNHHKDSVGESSFPYLIPPEEPEPKDSKGSVTCRILRSLSEWSGATETETSLYWKTIQLIRQSQHFIYWENNFFISSLAGGGVENDIADALLQRIRLAHQRKEVFRVYILLSLTPDGLYGDSARLRYLMHW